MILFKCCTLLGAWNHRAERFTLTYSRMYLWMGFRIMVFKPFLIPFLFVFFGFNYLWSCWCSSAVFPNRSLALPSAGKPVVLSKEVESVLVGAAVLGACASGDFTSIQVCSTWFYVIFCSVLMCFTPWLLAPHTDLDPSGRVCPFCRARQEPASLSLHPLFNSRCYLGALRIHLSLEYGDMHRSCCVWS